MRDFLIGLGIGLVLLAVIGVNTPPRVERMVIEATCPAIEQPDGANVVSR